MNFAAFYVGPSLPAHMQACLRSWVDFGHSIELYTYDPDLVMPRGVQRRDAAEILPSSAIFTHGKGVGKGTIAAFSDEFRFRLCQARDVIWVDTDQLCLRADWPQREYLFAWQTSEKLEINIAVFGAPADSELLRVVLDEINAVDKAEAYFGQVGPVPFTRAVRKLGLEHLASDPTEFYPLNVFQCRYFLDPELREEALRIVQGSYAVHLWNEVWTRQRFPTFLRPPKGSFLELIYERHGVTIPIEAYVDDLDALTVVPSEPVVTLAEFEKVSTWASSLETELQSVREWAASMEHELTAGHSRGLVQRIRAKFSA